MYKITLNKQIWESQSETLSGKFVPGPKQAVKQLHTRLGQKIKSCWGVSRSTGKAEPHRAPSWGVQLCWGSLTAASLLQSPPVDRNSLLGPATLVKTAHAPAAAEKDSCLEKAANSD